MVQPNARDSDFVQFMNHSRYVDGDAKWFGIVCVDYEILAVDWYSEVHGIQTLGFVSRILHVMSLRFKTRGS